METAAERNRKFYNKVASIYRQADGRRNGSDAWAIVRKLSKAAHYWAFFEPCRFLDLGAGDGFIAEEATRYFQSVVAIDISEKMLMRIKNPSIIKIVGSADKLAVEDNSCNVVCAYAVFHHLEDYKKPIQEIFRVLKPNGIFYMDADITETFYQRFGWLVEIYRFIRRPHKRFKVTKEEFNGVEVGQKGIDDAGIIDFLKKTGFVITIISQMPVLRLIARKE